MNSQVVYSLISAIVFLVMASPAVYSLVKSSGVKSADMSLVVRSVIVWIVMYVIMMVVKV
jgi:hypothetical protein